MERVLHNTTTKTINSVNYKGDDRWDVNRAKDTLYYCGAQ